MEEMITLKIAHKNIEISFFRPIVSFLGKCIKVLHFYYKS